MTRTKKRKSIGDEEPPSSSKSTSIADEEPPSKRTQRTQPGAAKRAAPSFIGQQTIVNVVIKNGESTETVPVHKSFICYYSPYFDAVFNGSFAEGKTQRVELEDAPPAAFNMFVNWLYTQDIADGELDLPDSNNLIDLWILADRFIVPRLQNQAMELILDKKMRAGHISVKTNIRAYENTARGSKLRSILVDRRLNSMLVSTRPAHQCQWPPVEMLEEMLATCITRMPKTTDFLDHPPEHYKIEE